MPGTVISSTAVNSDFSDIASALTQSVSYDGQTAIIGILRSSVTNGPSWASTIDNTTGFGVSAIGEADIWVAGSKVVTITGTSVQFAVSLNLSGLKVISTQAGISVSFTSANPTIITWTAHGFLANQPVYFNASVMPGGFSSTQCYYVVGASINTNTFEVSTLPGGSALAATSTGTTVLGFTPALQVSGDADIDNLTVTNLSCSTATITSLNATGLPLPTPQGYLTLLSNTPIITTDVTAASTVYYTPFQGNWSAVHNGTAIVPFQFSQMPLVLTASQAASNIYDVFQAYNGGTEVIGTGPSWAASGGSVTPGSCSRGVGAGSTAVARDATTGLWVNTNSMSLIFNTGSGNTTITVAAGQGIYLGSIFIDTTQGQTSCFRSYGQSRKWGVWNTYNRAPLTLQVGDSSASWAYDVATIRQSNATAGNGCSVFCGLAEEQIGTQFQQKIEINTGSTTLGALIGVGINSTTAFSGTVGQITITNLTQFHTIIGTFTQPPTLGITSVNCLEESLNANAGAVSFFGSQTNMLLQAMYRG